MRLTRLIGIAAAVVAVGVSPGAQATSFTGPISPYYLDGYDSGNAGRIYVVQGSGAINSFPTVYASGNGTPYQEGNLAVTNMVSTNWFGNNYAQSNGTEGVATGGQYTLGGTPTGTSWTGTPPPAGEDNFYIYDGTSDGTYNYAVEWYNGLGGANVIRTDANWQNPTALFPVSGSAGEYVGITYDVTNNSLWISGYGSSFINNYDLTGNLLSSFDTGLILKAALAFDAADGTLWFSYGETNHLFQYSTSGVLLQDGTPSGLPDGRYLAGEFAESGPATVPEPSTLALFYAGLLGLSAMRRRKAKA